MAQWAVLLPTERYEAERMFHHDSVDLPVGDEHPAPGDEVLLVAEEEEPVVVAVGRAGVASGGRLRVAYTRRGFDEPAPADGLALRGPVTPVPPALFTTLAGRVSGPPSRGRWLVSVDLPIEADSPGEAVRQFWSYVMELGPRELPAFVSPSGNELAMQAYVLGAATNLDPEEG